MTWVTWGACAGHPAAPNAPNRELSDRGESAPPLPPPLSISWGLGKPPKGPAKASASMGQAASLSSVPRLELWITNCPSINTHLRNSDLCLHQQEEAENQIKSKMMQ